MNNKKFKKGEELIPYSKQWLDNNDIKEVVKVLKSDWLTQGPKVEEFEKAIADYCDVKYGVIFPSGTTALFAAYNAAGLCEGDEVIMTPLTFAATSNMLMVWGVKPVFVDVEPDSLNINPDLISEKITSKTKAIVAVDFAGHPCNYSKILKIAKKHDLFVIEDASHSLGAEYKGKRIGKFSDLTILSFHPVKHITTGEGGMVITDSKKFYEKLKFFRNHGIIRRPDKGKWYYEVEEPFFNFRVTDIQCALGLSQLKKIDKFLKIRRKIAKTYNKAFENIKEIITPSEKDYAKSAWHIYPIQIKKRNRKKIFEKLRKLGIGVQVHYMPLHLHPLYKKTFGYKKGNFPIAEKYYERAITLPLFPKMTDKEVNYVINSVINIIIRSRSL